MKYSAIDGYAGEVLDAEMAAAGWRRQWTVKAIRRYYLKNAEVEVRLKTSIIATGGGRGPFWSFTVAQRGETLDADFYSKPESFLALVMLDIQRESRLPLLVPKVLLVPGKDVLEHFSYAPRKTYDIHISKSLFDNYASKWSKYQGVEATLAREFKRQMGVVERE